MLSKASGGWLDESIRQSLSQAGKQKTRHRRVLLNSGAGLGIDISRYFIDI